MPAAKNVLGTELEVCSRSPLTGFYRDGCCNTGADDAGLHLVCAEVTDAFLNGDVFEVFLCDQKYIKRTKIKSVRRVKPRTILVAH